MELERKHNIEKIRQLCIAVNPELTRGEWLQSLNNIGEPIQGQITWVERRIRLADVLRILDKAITLASLITGDMLVHLQLQIIERAYGRIAASWNLKKDYLELQSLDSVRAIMEVLNEYE